MVEPMTRRFEIVDVFAERRLEGNQLAVFFDAAAMSTDEMLAVARETNFSETTFVCGGDASSGYDVRIFTPSYEMPFAGHPTLGTAAVLRRRGSGDELATVTLNLEVGPVPVRFDDDLAWLAAPPVTLKETLDRDLLARSLSVATSDLHPSFPCQLVSSGPDFVMVPMANLDAIERARLDLDAFAPLAKLGVPAHIYLFALGARDASRDLTVRLFFNAGGIREDPATGSAAVCLGAYLAEHEMLGASTRTIDVTLSQGTQIDRPSVLHLRAQKREDDFAIEVGGRVEFVAAGDWIR